VKMMMKFGFAAEAWMAEKSAAARRRCFMVDSGLGKEFHRRGAEVAKGRKAGLAGALKGVGMICGYYSWIITDVRSRVLAALIA